MGRKSDALSEIKKFLENSVDAIDAFLRLLYSLGIILVFDDRKDIGKTGLERYPPRPHHYQIGILMTILSGYGLKKYYEYLNSLSD